MEREPNFELRQQKMKHVIETFNRRQAQQLAVSTQAFELGSRRSYGSLKTFDPETLKSMLDDPKTHSSELLAFSEYLYYSSPTYKKVIQFYSTLPTYNYVVDVNRLLDPADAEGFKKTYWKTLELLKKMNLKHELQKLAEVAWRQDVVYCYEMESKDSYYLKHMPVDYCRISSVEDGVFNYEFDFSLFLQDSKLLKEYPSEFTEIFLELERIKKNSKDWVNDMYWYELNPAKAFAYKINEDTTVAIPPFLESMESALDEDLYRRIKKSKDALDNFMALTQKIPLNDDDQTMDVFRLNYDIAMDFHMQASEQLPDGIGLITSPMDITAIKLEKSNRDEDLEMRAKDNTLSNAGLPPNIFSTTNKTAGGIKYAIRYLEQVIFKQLRQMERWINRKLKYQSGKYKLSIRFLDVTHFSTEDYFDTLLKGASASLPVKQEASSVLGLSPMDMYNKALIENQILGLNDILEPLVSAHTQSRSDRESGREKLKDDKISESTEVWRENRTDE